MDDEPALSRVLRRHEYTGENRCWPCTAVNVCVAVVASTLVGVLALELGVLVLVLSGLAIYFRGYLVPGTPALTERFLPEGVLALFGKKSEPRETTSWDAIERHRDRKENAVDAEEYLDDAGVIKRDPGDSFTLTAEFDSRLQEHLDTLASEDLWWHDGTTNCDTEAVADVLGADVADVDLREETYPAVQVDARVRQWPSEPALRADVATHRALADFDDDWQTVPREQRLRILTALRSFRDVCPCGGPLEESVEAVDSCCRSGEVFALQCAACGEPLLERDVGTNEWVSVDDI